MSERNQWNEKGYNERMRDHAHADYEATHGRRYSRGLYIDDRPLSADPSQDLVRRDAVRGSRRNHAGLGPKTAERSDQQILEDVCDRLTEDSHIDARDITVTCAQGLVTLEGVVENRAIKYRVEDLVAGCRGVKDIANRLTVLHPGHPLYQEQQVAQGNRSRFD